MHPVNKKASKDSIYIKFVDLNKNAVKSQIFEGYSIKIQCENKFKSNNKEECEQKLQKLWIKIINQKEKAKSDNLQT